MKLSKLVPTRGLELASKRYNSPIVAISSIGITALLILICGAAVTLSSEPALYRGVLVAYILSMTGNFYYWKEL